MKHYEKTEGYKWTNGDGKYYTELYTPDNAPLYELVSIENIPTEEEIYNPTEAEYAEAGKILLEGED